MSKYESLQKQHDGYLVRLDRQPTDIEVQEIIDFIEQIKAESADIIDPLDRDQLRAILRFWASYIYDQKGEYPETTLRNPDPEKSKQFSKQESQIKRPYILAGLGLVLLITLLIYGVTAIVSRVATNRTIQLQQIAEKNETATQMAMENQQGTVEALWTSTPTETQIPTITSTPTAVSETKTPTLSATPANTPLPIVGTKIEIINIANADKIKPETTLVGYYAGLSAGASIHILLQPINKCGSNNILVENFYLVTENNGQWEIPVNFGSDSDLLEPEQYNVQVYYAENEAVREQLLSNKDRFTTCFNADDLPTGFSLYKDLLLNVSRGKYENRLIFASREADSFYYDIATSRLDGTDFRLLMDTEEIDERDPHLCKGNQKIVFIDKTPRSQSVQLSKLTTPGETLANQSLWVMQADGSNKELILAEENVLYERPVWSPDCRYIAYNVYRPEETVTWEIKIIDFENQDKGSLMVAYGRYQSWLPVGHTLIYNRPFEEDKLPSFIQLTLDECKLDFENNKHDCKQFSKFYTNTGLPVQGLQPVISPDGKRLAFTTHVMITADGRYYQHIRGFDLDGSEPVYDITTSDRLPTDWFPYWGPDSDPQTIYFQSWRRENTNIWRINLDGTGMQPVGPKDRININVSQALMFVPSTGP